MIRLALQLLMQAFEHLREARAAKRAIEREHAIVPHVMYGTGPDAKPFEVD